MSAEMTRLSDDLYKYFLSICPKEDPLLQELRQKTYALDNANVSMHVAPEQAQLMYLLVKILQPQRVIEVGVFTGYSSISIAKAMPSDGHMIACDSDARYTAIAQDFWRRAAVDHKITLKLAPALDTLTELLQTDWAKTCDLIFIDADKSNYDNYYNISLDLLRSGGLILIDNIFWHGKVTNATLQDAETTTIRTLNAAIPCDPRIESSVVPIGDGMTIIRKR